jgi:hypothetical protein
MKKSLDLIRDLLLKLKCVYLDNKYIVLPFFRVRIGNAPVAKVTGPGNLSALEISIKGFAEKQKNL